MRFFMVNNVYKTGQKNNKGREIKTSGYQMIFRGMTPSQAAKKAMTALCKRKEYSGMCALRVKLVEVMVTESGSPKRGDKGYIPMLWKTSGEEKEFTYRLQKRKLKVPVTVNLNGVDVTYKYESIIRSDLNKKKVKKVKK